MTRYRIFPSIGIARVGEDDDYILGPEVPGRGPQERDGGKVQRFKNADRKRIRKQAARFHLFQSEDGADWVPAELPEGAVVTWTVALQNRKAAVQRPEDPPTQAERPVIDPAKAALLIDAGTASVSGPDAGRQILQGLFATTDPAGTPVNVPVTLGTVFTDSAGRLIVLPGDGDAASPSGTDIGFSYYENPGWYDDVADGPVSAKVRLPDGAESSADGAWFASAPPDYAPEIGGAVTLWDVIRQVGIDHLGAPAPAGPPSFDRDILPMIERVRRLRWVHDPDEWSDVRLDKPELRSKAAAQKPLRTAVRGIVLKPEDLLAGHTSGSPPYRLRAHQKTALLSWVNGDFDDTPSPWPDEPTAEGLTRAALEGAVGQGFCPGIEAGILVLDPGIYVRPFDFRLDHEVLQPGDLTALMAQPWQADFQKCHTNWWPAQRPDWAPQSEDPSDNLAWNRGATSHQELVDNHARLGFIVRSGADEVFIEAERDPTL